MAKKIVQDVLPRETKSIRNIPISNRRQSTYTQSSEIVPPRRLDSRRTAKKVEPQEEPLADYSTPPRPPKNPYENNFTVQKSSKKGLWIVTAFCVLVLAFAVSFLFVHAQVEITPKTETANLNVTLNAEKTPTDGGLGFEIVTISKESGKIVDASGEEKVEKKSSGRIVIYNKNSKTSQKLIASTRFETSQGLIYRIAEAVTIPGYTTKGSDIVPGSVVATIYADKAGESYNIGLSDFTIPGFKGDPKFTNIYARSETVMQGGFVGTVKKITPEKMSATEDSLKSQLRDQLITEVKSQIPDSFVFYPDAVSFVFELLPQSEVKDSSVKINEKGTITAVIFDKKTLNAELAKESPTQAEEGEVVVSNLSELALTLPDNTILSSASDKDIKVTIKGNAHFVWVIDEEKIKHDLMGKPKKSLSSVLSTYQSVDKAKATLRPFWKLSFPKNTDKISLEVKAQQ